ncbi:MAG TPA: hypothetical protein VIQ03_02550 [Gammaproteobacteria bacterium]
MHIPTLYVLIFAEIIFLLLVAAITLGIYAFKLNKRLQASNTKPQDDTETDKPINQGSSYAEYLQQELDRNSQKAQQQQHIENEDAAESTEKVAADEQQSALLKARDMFLNIEKSAVEHTENENLFWDHIYKGMKDILARFKTIEHESDIVTREVVAHKTTTKEKVFYIETQGKKVDGEVNKLKDIIYEQENTLSSLQKALARSVEHEEQEEGEITELQKHITDFERQIRDSKMCMDVLEMENERLQHEINELETRLAESGAQTSKEQSVKASVQNTEPNQFREVLEQQEIQIDELNLAIDNLKLEADQADRLKTTIKNFTRTSQEMMGCIVVLEDENETLHNQIQALLSINDNGGANQQDIDQYKSKIKDMEQEIIKQDVAYAKLQDEFSAMEKEYLAMYKAVHGE